MADGDITRATLKPDGVKDVVKSVTFLIDTKTCKVIYKQEDINGNQVGTTQHLFRNVLDDPETPEDETKNDFTKLVQKINAENNIKISIMEAVLELEAGTF